MPRMGKTADGKPDGLDVAVAERLAAILNRSIEFHWCASAQCAWHCLPDGRCDVVLGQPYNSGPLREVAWSVPYAEARFGLVVPRASQAASSLGGFSGKRVGIVAGTSAISEKDHAVVRFKSREELFGGFRTTALDAAFLDVDFAAWYLRDHRQLGLRVLPDYVPRERWNMALAVRVTDAQLLVEIAFNRAPGSACRVRESCGGLYDRVPEVPFHVRPFQGLPPAKLPADTCRRVRERGEASHQHGPRQPAVFQRQGRPARV